MIKQYHYVYEITNTVNGKIYIGMHSTYNLDDGYMGSGKMLKYAIKKYGIECFKKRILQHFDSRIDAAKYEASLITEDLIASKNTYNLAMGNENCTYACNTTKGFKYVSNEFENKFIRKEDIPKFLEQGYVIGINLKLYNTKRKKRKCDYNSLRYINSRASLKNKICLKSPENRLKYVHRDDNELISKLLSEGYVYGSVDKSIESGTFIWVNNGTISKFISKLEFEEYSKNGFVRGRLKLEKYIPQGSKKITPEEIIRRNEILDRLAFKSHDWKSLVQKEWNSKIGISKWCKRRYPEFYEKHFKNNVKRDL